MTFTILLTGFGPFPGAPFNPTGPLVEHLARRRHPALAGVRRVGAPPRQLLFRAGDVDVDVKIESMEANDRITLVGQVLSNTAKFFDNTPVKLESHGIVRYRTRTNLVGEFSFDEVPKDTYHLSVDLPEGQITLFCVHRGNS